MNNLTRHAVLSLNYQLPSSSSKFVSMTCAALEKFEAEHGIKFKKITQIPLEGDGTISRKTARYVRSIGRFCG